MSPVPATISGRGETQSFHNIQTSVINSGIELATKCQLKKIQAKRLFWRCHCKVSFVLWDPVEVLVSILSARTEGGGTEVPEVEHGQRREEEQDGLRVSGDEEHLG